MYVERFVQRIPYGHFVRENVELSEHLMQGDINTVANLLGTHFSYLLYATIHPKECTLQVL